MKALNVTWYIGLLFAVASVIPWFLTMGYSQTRLIDAVRFDPPNPQPGDPLKLSITLFHSNKDDRELSIRLLTWRDLDNDCKYTKPEEEVEHPMLRVKDNEVGKDEKADEDEILVRIYNVPQDHPPQKYIAIVTFGQDVKSESITVPLSKATVCNPTDVPSAWSVHKAISIPYEVAKGLRVLKDSLRREGAREAYQGGHSLYVYTLQEKKLERVVYSGEAFYLSPTWSFDNAKVALIVKHGEKKTIAWVDTAEKTLQVLTTGRDDKTPFWLPDNAHIVFVRENRLRIVDVASKEVQGIGQHIQMDQILGVAQGAGNTVQVIYEAPNRYTSETKEIYMLELDSRFASKGVVQLVNNPIWFLIPAVSPAGEQVIYSEKGTIFTWHIKAEKAERLFEKDERNDYEPSWSPDGSRIALVSNRPT